MARLLVLLFCISMATTQRNGNIVKDRGKFVFTIFFTVESQLNGKWSFIK